MTEALGLTELFCTNPGGGWGCKMVNPKMPYSQFLLSATVHLDADIVKCPKARKNLRSNLQSNGDSS